MKQKVLADAKKGKDKALERQIRKKAGGICPFKTNRGFDFDDPECLKCSDKGCQQETQRRLLAILYGFQNGIGVWDDYDTPNDTHEYLDATQNELSKEWFDEKRQSIRDAARAIIQNDISPNDSVHPNTRLYFQNCFPEWNKYELAYIKNKLREHVYDFYVQEKEKCHKWNYYWLPSDKQIEEYGLDSEDEDREERLIAIGDWRGFPFDDLITGNDETIPAKTRKQFAQDYFKSVQNVINQEKEAAERTGLFGKKQDREKWPRRWMMRNKKIKDFIESKNGKFFIELLKYLEVTRMNMQEGKQIAKKFGHEKKNYVLVQVDRQHASEYLSKRPELKNISTNPLKIQRLVKAMTEHGLLIKLGKPGPREATIFAIGKWFAFPDPVTGEMKPGGIRSFVKEENKKNLLKMIESQI